MSHYESLYKWSILHVCNIGYKGEWHSWCTSLLDVSKLAKEENGTQGALAY